MKNKIEKTINEVISDFINTINDNLQIIQFCIVSFSLSNRELEELYKEKFGKEIIIIS